MTPPPPAAALDPAALLAALADAAMAGTTRTSVARRVAQVLAAALPLVHLELGWCLASGEADAVVVTLREEVEVLSRRDLHPPLREERDATPQRLALGSAPAPWSWLLPLNDDAQRGYALLGFRQVVALPHGLLEAIARVLLAAERHLLLLERVARLSRRAYKENQDLRRQLEQVSPPGDVVAVSAPMREVLQLAAQVAPHNTTVLINGESGTGKEVIARHIHTLSPRRDQPFVQVNCGAMPQDLVESELFGHEKGAFTSATNRHIGRFERAHGGTLLLDEVGELPLHAQVKLLRVLQEGELERVGGEQNIKVDVRVIAATHRDLEAMVQRGDFRADLFYRLNVFPLAILPLRERPEDIPALVSHLGGAIARRLGRPAPTVPPEVLASLCRAPWPGNVRELENVIERATILSPGDRLQLPLALSVASHSPRPELTARADAPLATLEEHIRAHILRALQHTEGRIYGPSGAAVLLGLKPSTLQSRMERLGIKRAG